MLRLKITLKPIKIGEINVNYRRRLNLLCKEMVKFRVTRNIFLKEEKVNNSSIYFSPLFCKSYEVNEGKILFKDNISWYLTCDSYSTILELIQGFHGKNIIKIGKAELEVIGIELSNLNNTANSIKNRKKSIYTKVHENSSDMVALTQ